MPLSVMFPLDDTVIIILPGQSPAEDTAVQVTVKTTGPASNVGLTSAYHLVQHEISDLILRLVSAYTHTKPPKQIEFVGDEYTVVASRKRWTYGRDKIRLMWGEDVVKPCAYKWSFTFHAANAGE
ncbi:hypothetical protein EUX98_g4429 [Antrodiella citrinella]|uniref:Uncharacterized protein n=1 Tax=Antrodiella citrinella TaxID=2447956 RepID=A0A4S4MTY5_9APHY|nr:hypothetical protein EUX98_g4429 [Antrodiella citrinella]